MTTGRKKLEVHEVQIGEDISPKIYSDLINDNNHEHNATEKTLNRTTIYTVGHSNVEFEKFLGLLNGINMLVDVRSVPFSKYVPQFNIDSIKARLQDAGIEYVFMKDEHIGNVLGGRPKDDTCYNNGDAIYEKVAGKEWYKKGISALIGLANEKNVVLMCGEEDPYKCHRHHLITQSLLREGVTVIHIRGDGSQEGVEKPDKKMIQLTLF